MYDNNVFNCGRSINIRSNSHSILCYCSPGRVGSSFAVVCMDNGVPWLTVFTNHVNVSFISVYLAMGVMTVPQAFLYYHTTQHNERITAAPIVRVWAAARLCPQSVHN